MGWWSGDCGGAVIVVAVEWWLSCRGSGGGIVSGMRLHNVKCVGIGKCKLGKTMLELNPGRVT